MTGAASARSGSGSKARRIGWLLVLLALTLHFLCFFRFMAIKPGAVGLASDLVRVAGKEAPPGGGGFLYATVDAGRASLVEAFWSLFDRGVELRPVAREVPSGMTWEEYAKVLEGAMVESLSVASVVALRHLGYRVSLDQELPVAIEAVEEGIGGTSAALMVALEVYRQVAGVEFAEGLLVAGTGTLRLDGRVEAVDGVRQKALAAERAGADLFLVPRANAAEAAAVAKRMRVVPVDTFEQIVSLLRSAGREEYPAIRGI